MKVASYIQKFSLGSCPKYSELEIELIDWFKESQSQLKVVTRYMIQAKVRSFTKSSIKKYIQI